MLKWKGVCGQKRLSGVNKGGKNASKNKKREANTKNTAGRDRKKGEEKRDEREISRYRIYEGNEERTTVIKKIMKLKTYMKYMQYISKYSEIDGS